MSDAATPREIIAESRLPSQRLGIMLAVFAIAVLPLVLNDSYWRTNLTLCAINVLLALGLDFILGYAGQLNLGHSALYGFAAYVSTVRSLRTGRPFLAG